MHETHAIVNGLMAGLSPEHRDMPTPCEKWTVHEVVEHMCQGGNAVAGSLEGQNPPDEMPDVMENGPISGWAATAAHLGAAATPDRLEATHQMSFGEVTGEMALSLIVADHVVHAWDVATATGQDFACSDELASWALQVWQGLVPAEPRSGDRFGPVVETGPDASAVDALVAYTGRQP